MIHLAYDAAERQEKTMSIKQKIMKAAVFRLLSLWFSKWMTKPQLDFLLI